MARRELGPASLEVARAVASVWPGGDVVVACSGGADSLALALGAAWAARRGGGAPLAVVVDHQLQPGSDEVARQVEEQLAHHAIEARTVSVTVEPGADGLEAAARDARHAALEAFGRPVLLGHTLDDQAEQVFLGLVRGSGTRAVAGMPARRGPFLRPLLGIRRATTERACAEWGVTPWHDPMNADPSFMRVRVRRALAGLEDVVGRDLAPNLARTASLARADADALDALVDTPTAPALLVDEIRELPDALRWRLLKSWLEAQGAQPAMVHVLAVDALVTSWRGQGPIDVPGGRVQRAENELRLVG